MGSWWNISTYYSEKQEKFSVSLKSSVFKNSSVFPQTEIAFAPCLSIETWQRLNAFFSNSVTRISSDNHLISVDETCIWNYSVVRISVREANSFRYLKDSLNKIFLVIDFFEFTRLVFVGHLIHQWTTIWER